jgi:hypothetical protein
MSDTWEGLLKACCNRRCNSINRSGRDVRHADLGWKKSHENFSAFTERQLNTFKGGTGRHTCQETLILKMLTFPQFSDISWHSDRSKGWTTEESGFNSRQECFLHIVHIRSGGKGGHGVKLTTRLYIVTQLWMRGTIPPLNTTFSWLGEYNFTHNNLMYHITEQTDITVTL